MLKDGSRAVSLLEAYNHVTVIRLSAFSQK